MNTAATVAANRAVYELQLNSKQAIRFIKGEVAGLDDEGAASALAQAVKASNGALKRVRKLTK